MSETNPITAPIIEGSGDNRHFDLTSIPEALLTAEVERRQKVENRRVLHKELLKAIAVGGALTLGALVAPNAVGPVASWIGREIEAGRRTQLKARIRRVFSRLRDQELIGLIEQSDGEVVATITDQGRERVLRYKLDELSVPVPASWDGRWRIVVFDIPETDRLGRDVLRGAMQRLGFMMLQKSTWVYPFPCRDQIDFISHIYDIGRYLLHIETDTLENEQFLLNYFKLAKVVEQ